MLSCGRFCNAWSRSKALSTRLAYHPHLSGENGHRKRIFSKTLSTVKIFENAGYSFACGQTKTEVFKYDDVIHHFLLALQEYHGFARVYS